MKNRIHTISILVSNKPGALVRISTIFARRAYNIESLVVSPALDGRFSRMTITAEGDPSILDQIVKQVSKLVDVIQASEHLPQETIEKEFALIKTKVHAQNRVEVLQLVMHFGALAIDFSDESIVIQISAGTAKLDNFIELLDPYGIIELVRTGKVIMARGAKET
jgi:acetolactate synthase I/III small subunit